MPKYLEKQAQINTLLFDKISINILVKYFDYSNISSIKYAVKFSRVY